MLADIADGNKPSSSSGKNEHPSFDSGRMDKVSFTSSVSVQNPRYALGMMLDKELHLVPVKSEFFKNIFGFTKLKIELSRLLSNETKLFVLR